MRNKRKSAAVKANEAPEKIYVNSEAIFTALRERRKKSDIEYTKSYVLFKKAREAFCKAMCNGNPPLCTCTSLGMCEEYDNFVRFMKYEE